MKALVTQLFRWLPISERIMRQLAIMAGRHPEGFFDPQPLMLSAGVSLDQRPLVNRMLTLLTKNEVLRDVGEGTYQLIPNVDYQRLAALVEGGALHAASAQSDPPELILTRPNHAVGLMEAMRESGQFTTYPSTAELLKHMASQCQHNLTLVMPFYDETGLAFLERVVLPILPSPARVRLLTRPADELSLREVMVDRPRLAERVDYRYYWRRVGGCPGNYETFHAKLMLADDKQAYVGSANLTRPSLELSGELGLWVQDKTALQLYKIVEAMWKAAESYTA